VVRSDGHTYALVNGNGQAATVFDGGAVNTLTCSPNLDPKRAGPAVRGQDRSDRELEIKDTNTIMQIS
jgi:hypothetical protein